MAGAGAPLNVCDIIAAALCTFGISVGLLADNQLHEYMGRENKPLILEAGLWRYSRHPNHL